MLGVLLLAAVPAWSGPADISPELLAYVPTRPNPAALDRLFEASRGRVLSVDAPPPTLSQALARAEKEAEKAAATQTPPRRARLISSHRLAIDQFDPIILQQAQKYRLNPSLVKVIIAAESEFRAAAKSHAGALGLMQLMPNTARSLGFHQQTLFQPESNIAAGAMYLAKLFQIMYRRYNLTGLYSQAPEWVVRRVLASYNAGLKFLRERPLYKETQKYIERVFLYKAAGIGKISRPVEPKPQP